MDVYRRLMGKPFTSKESDYVGNEKINVKAHAQYDILNKRWQINTLQFGYIYILNHFVWSQAII